MQTTGRNLDRVSLSRRPAPGTSHLRQKLSELWVHRWIRSLAGIGAAAVAGIGAAFAMPRGPITTAGALALLGIALGAGVLAGIVIRSRWAMLLAPAANVIAFELARPQTDAPSADTIRLDTNFGILALVLSRGFYLLIAAFPMAVGANYGAAFARRLASPHPAGSRTRRYARRTAGALAGVGVALLALLIAWPASTPAITGPGGERLTGSVAELSRVRLGGQQQWLLIRGESVDNPVLLWLNGGPGQSGMAFSRALFADLERDFIVVDWDQRGAGKSYPAFAPVSHLTLEQAVADTIELTNHLRQRFDEEKIFIGGESWGTTLGVLAVQARPDLFHAYIGSGQMVSQRETDSIIYRDRVDYAARTGDQRLAARLQALGEPPYADVWAYGVVLENYERIETDFEVLDYYEVRFRESGIGPWGVLGSEYTFVEKLNVLRGLIDTFSVMYPQLQQIDFRRDVQRLDVPVYLFAGAHELRGRQELALQWYDQLEAPIKSIYTFENAGHAPAQEQYEDFHRILVEIILPQTYPSAVT